ncbi:MULTISPECIES: polyamine aminopropyltransferase [Prochlorococcus]|uniref:Polyamine aminopropyltransferase n=1 Tax=Prochlorococcus marinus (strain SARG / CCMP1375 / SS120) TaxID=167539 RepID=SPEE_PROMA|nr:MULTISPECIES: polyamine aminopropyltransferase [Prochlorococcus]Q7V9I5.1 RecName: Full=Polyamine aminopropyltransferase; AltName: Full=Putrescine aminopropyltransferase; Short=PAPT; AltName: Full=Spermidine synthase; Short=SPDS; Short=SPDSY [Prochlorococcus marinus subsp. marinus str. CCMP1375]AAQ00892.1 Spermidine synthase [Prochlorococcus marinus subsp. marinus str. CCMP1375]KGG10614.1 Spermidine synthase [Prochlorococcus marinus str. LG]KGG19920.1 Spermidine synthase [Prochlorococcus mari
MFENENPNGSWLDEYQNDVRYGLKGKKIIEEISNFQKITIFESNRYGKALLLDNCWMTAEYQEKQYHECIVHPALCGSKEINKVLIIGGGDGGSARECLKYQELKNLDLIEIDKRVVELSQQYLSVIGGNCWKDQRLNLKLTNGINWVKDAKDNSYDVIIIDGSDPKGPAKGLFNKDFFKDCHRILKPDGVLGAQTESPESFEDIHINTVKMIKEVFKYADPLYGYVPIYPSGIWSWTFASIKKPRHLYPIISRANTISKTCQVWSPRWQRGGFDAIPANIERKLQQ